jgi:thiosulfate reductase cytochrome b subunit
VPNTSAALADDRRGHRLWVRLSHWIIACSILTLLFSGILIFMVHPRLYWGEVGNDLVPAILEIPITDNHRPEGWERTVSFGEAANQAYSANRLYDIFNNNGFARSLHFLAAWCLLLAALYYVFAGLVSGHVRQNLLPRPAQVKPSILWEDLRQHLRPVVGSSGGGPPYGVLQRLTYIGVVFVALPLMVFTGLCMSPAVTAAYPGLLDFFGGYQSARTLHFFGFSALVLFIVVHVAMVLATGLIRQLRAMTLGS